MKYVALLRAINVGGHTVKMERLRGLFEELGYGSVSTFIASGNVLFDASRTATAGMEQRIETHLADALGYDVATFIRTPAELAAAAAYTPFTGSPPDGPLYVAFLKKEPDAARTSAFLALATDLDRFAVHGREAYWLSVTGMGKSKFSGAKLEKALGTAATMRNITTVGKLAAL